MKLIESGKKMKIKVEDIEINDEWHYAIGKCLLDMQNYGSDCITWQQRDILQEQISKWLWEQVQKQFPRIVDFVSERAGEFNFITKDNFDTPIISIGGSFYMQLIGKNDKHNWITQSIDFQPHRFFFNEEGCFRQLVIDAINKHILENGISIEVFKPLVTALQELPVKESIITIQTRGKDIGKTELHKVDSKIQVIEWKVDGTKIIYVILTLLMAI